MMEDIRHKTVLIAIDVKYLVLGIVDKVVNEFRLHFIRRWQLYQHLEDLGWGARQFLGIDKDECIKSGRIMLIRPEQQLV